MCKIEIELHNIQHKWYIPDVFASRQTTGPRSNQLHIIGCVVNYLISDQQENMYAGNEVFQPKENYRLQIF